jgi:hypothetical protein
MAIGDENVQSHCRRRRGLIQEVTTKGPVRRTERQVMTLVNINTMETQANDKRQKADAEMKLSVEISKRGNERQGASPRLADGGSSPQGWHLRGHSYRF